MTPQQRLKEIEARLNKAELLNEFYLEGLEKSADEIKSLEAKCFSLEKRLAIAVKTLRENADEDYRGNRSSESVRSFKALSEICT